MTTYGQIEREVHILLANIVGGDVTTMETNYAAASTAANRQNPDMGFTPVRDAIIEAMAKIRLAIAETPRYPDWTTLATFINGLGSPSNLPEGTGAGVPRIGPIGVVEDAETARPMILAPLASIRDHNINSTGIYAGADVYLYAFSGHFLYHTRPVTLARAWFNTYERDVFSFANPIPLRDHHAQAIVQGAIDIIAQKEGRYQSLQATARASFEAHLAGIRAHGLKTGEESADTPSAV